MSVFKRANWHSGLTYKRTCENCKTTVQYTDYSLDYRPWFADGFVYCPSCQKPLRHNESYAIENHVVTKVVNLTDTNDNEQHEQTDAPQPSNTANFSSLAVFCVNCGHKFISDSDAFCSKCGKKRT